MAKRRPRPEDQLSLFGAPENGRDEQIRRARDAPLGDDRSGAVSDDRGPADVLSGAGRTGGDADPGTRRETGRSGPARGGVPAEAGAPEHGAPAGRRSDPDGARVDLWAAGGERGADDRVGDADDARDPRSGRRRGDRGLAFRPRTQDDLAPSGARSR